MSAEITVDPMKVHILDIDIRSNASIDQDKLQGLAESLKNKGQLHPIAVRAHPQLPGEWVIIAGKRRTLAAQSIQLPLQARVFESDEAARMELALIENLQREDMNPIDIAFALEEALDNDARRYRKDIEAAGVDEELKKAVAPLMDQQTLARTLSVSPAYVSQHLAMLELPKSAQKMLRDGKAGFAQARQLNRLKAHPEAIEAVLEKIEMMSHGELEKYANNILVDAKVKEAAEEKIKAETEPASATAPKKKRTAKDDADEDAAKKPSLADQYLTVKFKPRTIEAFRTVLVDYAGKAERAKSEEKKLEYKFILKGIEIGAGMAD